MKKIMLILFILSIPIYSEAGFNPFKWLFGGGPKIDVSKRENVKTGVTDGSKVASDIEILSKLDKIMEKIEVNATVNADLEAKITGLDKSIKSGRDTIQINKNDAKLMAYIIGGILTTLSGIITGLITVITLLIRKVFKNQIGSLKLWLSNLQEEKRRYAKELDDYRKNGTIK